MKKINTLVIGIVISFLFIGCGIPEKIKGAEAVSSVPLGQEHNVEKHTLEQTASKGDPVTIPAPTPQPERQESLISPSKEYPSAIDWRLLLCGALGALLTVYLVKQAVVPEFRPLFDTSDMENEARGHLEHIRETEKDIDSLQAKLREESVIVPDLVQRLTEVLRSSQCGLRAERMRLESLERSIMRSQIISRSLGFLLYIGLGGLFGALLAGRVKIAGLNEGFSLYFQSAMIGATWTSYLSTIGFRSGQGRADDRIETAKNEAEKAIIALRKEIIDKVANEVADAEKREKVPVPVRADAVAKFVADKIDQTNKAVLHKFDMARQMVEADLKGLL